MTDTERFLRLFYAEFISDPDTTWKDEFKALEELIKLASKTIDKEQSCQH